MVKQGTKDLILVAGCVLVGDYLVALTMSPDRRATAREMMNKKPLGTGVLVGGLVLVALPLVRAAVK